MAVVEHGISHAALLRIGSVCVCNESKLRRVVKERECPSTSGVSLISVIAFVKEEAAVNDRSLKLRVTATRGCIDTICLS
jgi:hypothetical protein